MLGWTLLMVGGAACLLEILFCWVLSYLLMRINWFAAITAFFAAFTVMGLGVITLILNGICSIISFIF